VKTRLTERTALHFAVKKHKIDIVDVLLSHNVDVNAQSNPDKITPLALAMISRYRDVVEKLLKVKDIDLDLRNISNEGPLILAMHLVNEHPISKVSFLDTMYD
jgi:ankyrin repeat protein